MDSEIIIAIAPVAGDLCVFEQVFKNDERRLLNKFLYHIYTFTKWPAVTGATISRLYKNDLEKMLIPIPMIKTQKEMVAKIDKVKEETDLLTLLYSKKLECLKDLKKAVLEQALKGELTE